MQEYWIIGGGRFGQRAAETLVAAKPAATVLVVEQDPGRCRELAAGGLHVLEADGIDFLKSHLTSPRRNLWIVAAAPVHVAYEWVLARLPAGVKPLPRALPADVVSRLPNAFRGAAEGQWYASNADFLCPSDCPEPGGICSFTGKKRPRSMHAFIEHLDAPGVKILVVRSRQLAPGVGGLRPRDLFDALDQMRVSRFAFLLATACKCHAVLNSFHIISDC